MLVCCALEELVSENAKFPASPIRGLAAPERQQKRARNQFLTGQFPTHPNREFFAALQGIKSGDQGSFRRDQGIPPSSAIWHSPLVTNPIVPTDFERCREGEHGRRQMLEVAEVDLELDAGFCPCERRARHAGNRSPSLSTRTIGRSALRDGGVGRIARRQLHRAPPQPGDRGFESRSLYRRVNCEPD
jgi:hypothetical protein